MHVPFVYSIKFVEPISKEKRWYIGSKYAKGCSPKDLWNSYFTSSNVVKNLLKEYGVLSFTTKIVKTFDDVTEARDYEEKLIRRAMMKGLRLGHELLNKSMPNSKWPVTTGIAPPNKGKKYEDYLDPEHLAKVKLAISKPKEPESMKKMVQTRRSRGTYDGGAKHPMARKFLLIDREGKQQEVIGALKKVCAELNLSWQTLNNNLNKGPIILDRTRYRNLARLTPKFFNTIGWELRSAS